MIGNLKSDVGKIVETDGVEGLQRLPGIGEGLSTAIYEIVSTGRLGQYDRLEGSLDPLNVLRSVPGIGKGLATLIHDELHVDSLEELEVAAHDGRLEKIRGMGERRVAAIRANLESMLRRTRRSAESGHLPGISLIFEIDKKYRAAATEHKLPLITPKRFNPEKKAWLPVLHVTERDWHFTAMFSNTARAHELKKTNEWVVIYFYDDDHSEGQCTVVTETSGRLRGLRVVRGREAECDSWYRLRNHRELVDHKINLVALP
jgi:putative hydrolase